MNPDFDKSSLDSQASNLMKEEHFNEAEKYYRKSLELSPNNEFTLSDLARCLSRQEKYEEAEKTIRQAIVLGGGDSYRWGILAEILFLTNQYSEGEDAYRKAIETHSPLLPVPAEYWLGLGVSLRQQGKYQESEEPLEKCLEIENGNAALWLHLGFTKIKLGKWEEVVTAGQKISELAPQLAEGWSFLGRGLMRQQQYEDAEKYLRKSLEITDNHIHSLKAIAYVLRKTKRYSEAEEAYRKSIELWPKVGGEEAPSSLWIGLGKTLTKLKRYEESLKALDEGLTIDPLNLDSLFEKFAVYRELDKLKNAEEVALRMIKIYPQEPRGWTSLAAVMILKKKFDDAEIAIKKALEIDEKNAIALGVLAKIHTETGRLTDAKAIWEEAIELWRKKHGDIPAGFWEEYAYSLFKMEKYDLCERMAYRCLEIEPANIGCLTLLVDVQIERGRPRDAPHIVIKALEHDKESPDIWFLLGRAYYSSERYDWAIDQFHAALKRGGSKHLILLWLGRAQLEAGHHKESEKTFKKAIDEWKKNEDTEVPVYYWRGLARVYFKLEDHKKARDAMKKVVALDQTSPYYFHDLGWAEYRCKNKKEAENALRKCMKLNPDSADIWDTIGKFFREIGNYEEVQSAFKRAKDLRKTMKEK